MHFFLHLFVVMTFSNKKWFYSWSSPIFAVPVALFLVFILILGVASFLLFTLLKNGELGSPKTPLNREVAC